MKIPAIEKIILIMKAEDCDKPMIMYRVSVSQHIECFFNLVVFRDSCKFLQN